VITEFTHRSHAHVILEDFLEPYYFNGKLTESGIDVVGLYVDQFPAGRDMARDVAKQFKIEIYPTIAEALRLGGKELAVDGVLPSVWIQSTLLICLKITLSTRAPRGLWP
jgi:hypothetical protein